MTDADGHVLAFLDPSVLDRLRVELDDDEGLWRVFVQNFIAVLPHRTDKLRLTLTTGDLTGALDAALSLKTSSQMVGAERLAHLALEVEMALRSAEAHAEPDRVLPLLAATHYRTIMVCARQTTYFLESYLYPKPGRS
jgi:HPt (histidine-containing phosphotransfer) domain-containing protein